MTNGPNNYYNKNGEKWSPEKGDWQSYQHYDKNEYDDKNRTVKMFAWVLLSITFLVFAVIILIRFF